MSSLGLHLRGLREAKGMSLDDIARSTRVGRRHLEALETDTMGELPAPVFVKGFIRAYCEFLDAAPDEALSLYREVTGEPAPSDGTGRSPSRSSCCWPSAPASSRSASGCRRPAKLRCPWNRWQWKRWERSHLPP